MERVTIEKAKDIFGSNFIGKDELLPLFRRMGLARFEIDLPEIHYTLSELEEYSRDYVLILGIPSLDSVELNIQTFRNIFGIDPSVSLTDLSASIGWDARVFGETVWNYLISLNWLDYIKVMGVVIFIHNHIRSSFSYFAAAMAKRISLFNLGNISFVMEIIGCALSFILMKMGHISPLNCLLFIIFLCVCIGLQLMFTITHISRLHRLINPKIRSLSSSVNMMTGRLMTSIMLMAPKFLLEHEGEATGIRVIDIFWIYALIFIPIGLYFIYKIFKYNVHAEHSLMHVSDEKA